MMKKAKSGRKNRSVTCKRVAGPDLCGGVAQKGRPLLTSWLVGTNSSHVFLDRPLADRYAQFQEFTPDAFSTPEPILSGHLLDQGDGLCRDLRRMRTRLGFALPIQTEELPMPPQQSIWLNNQQGLLPGTNQPG